MKPEMPLVQLPSISTERARLDRGSNVEQPNVRIDKENNTEKGISYNERQEDNVTVSGGVVIPTSLPTPVLNNATVATNTTNDDNPIVANDDSLIEKEWVDRAKKIVSDTRDDPYKQEDAVNKLQADYLHKRHGEGLDYIK